MTEAVRRTWIPYLILALALLLTAIGTFYLARTTEAQDQLRFANLVQKNQAVLQNRMETYIALLQGTASLFAASDQVSQQDFHDFVANLDVQRRYPGIQGIGYSLRIPAEWKGPYTDAIRDKLNDPTFQIRPESPREDLFPVLYLEPLDRRNRAALGLDMSTQPDQRAAMERARDTGRPAATGRVTLVQEIDPHKQSGFVIYVPVFHRGLPTETAEARRAALAGFVYAPFRAGDLLQSTLGRGNPSLALEVFAGQASAGNILHRSHSPKTIGPAPRFTSTQGFELAGYPWAVRYSTLPAFEAGSTRDQAALLLMFGLVTSLTLFTVTRDQVAARSHAEKVAADLKRSERELREEAVVSEALRAIGTALAGKLDFKRLLQTITDEARSVTGASYGAFFYNVLAKNADEDAYMLYTLSGAPPEAFEQFPMPRNTAIFDPTFTGQGIVRLHDVLADPRYGRSAPYHGMPPGHLPVRSYLAAPVVSRSGEIVGGLFFGHPEPGIFTARAERVLAGIAMQAAVAIDNARLYEAERRARDESETANRAKDRFMATLSHELRTPLTPVLAVLARLEAGTLAGEVRDGLTVIRRNVELEARLIDDLLDVTRITQGKLELRRGPADLRQVLSHALEASGVPGAAGPRMIVEIAEEDDLRLQADAPRLTQVFWNLLSNARKFTPPDGTVRVRAWREGTEPAGLVVEISDTGIGIDPDLLPRIFEAFQQGQRTITRHFGGLGLGLAICERIVGLHGGGIAAESAGRGMGSTFTVRLPAGEAAGEAEALATPAAEPTAAVVAAAATAGRPLHILLIEDHADTAEAMAELLRATGRKVTVAHCVADGLSTVAALLEGPAPNGGIDLVLSDLGLPDGSGLDLMAELSRRYGLRGIALTGYGMDDDVARSRAAGFARHLTKPVSLEQLDAAIRQVATRG